MGNISTKVWVPALVASIFQAVKAFVELPAGTEQLEGVIVTVAMFVIGWFVSDPARTNTAS